MIQKLPDFPIRKNAPIEEVDNWPRLVQIAWQVHDALGNLKSRGNKIIKPEGYTIPFNAQKVHGISTEQALLEGDSLKSVLDAFTQDLKNVRVLVGHNIDFDNKIVGAEFYRCYSRNLLTNLPTIDTCFQTKEFTKLKGGFGGRLKAPKLIELYEKLFETSFKDAHDAAHDVDATAKSFLNVSEEEFLNRLSQSQKRKLNIRLQHSKKQIPTRSRKSMRLLRRKRTKHSQKVNLHIFMSILSSRFFKQHPNLMISLKKHLLIRWVQLL